MKNLFTLFFLLVSLYVFGQKDTTPDYKYAIKTSPLNILDPWNGTLVTLGAELKLYKNIASYTEYGRYFPKFNVFNDISSNKGFVLKEEIKYYLNNKSKKNHDYVSIEFCYSEQTYYRKDTVDLTQNGGIRYSKKYFVSRNFPGIVFQYGTLLIKRKRLIIDIYGGLGIRFNKIKCDLTEEEAEHRELGDWNNANNYIQKQGEHIIPKFNCGIKIGYKLK